MNKKNSSLSRIRITFIISTLFLVALFTYVFIQLKNLIDSSDWVNHTSQVSLSLEKIATAAGDIELNQKNFLLTRDSSFLIKRDSVFKVFHRELNTVNGLVEDNPAQRADIKLLQDAVNKRLLSMNNVIKRNSPLLVSLEQRHDVSDGIRKSEIIRKIIDGMTLNEMNLLQQRTQKYSNHAFITRFFVFLLFLAASFILVVSYYRIDHAYHRAKNLEDVVNERTAKLNRTLISNEILLKTDRRYGEWSSSLEEKLKEHAAELQETNEALRLSEDKYHQMVAEVQDYAIILMDKNGIVENWNKGAEKIKGYKAEEIIGKSFSNFYSAEAQANRIPQQLLAEATEKGKSSDENWRIRKDGSRFWGSIVITALRDYKNNVIGFVKITRDLTEKKLAEEEIKVRAQQLEINNMKLEKMNKELQSFAYISSHDLQEPLRKIQTFASIIVEKEQGNLSEDGKRILKKMREAAGRMRTLIDDLLTYSRVTKADPFYEVTDMTKVVSEIEENFKEQINEKRADIEVTGLKEMNVIPFQFHQLMHNLIGNSLKYSNPNRSPEIKINVTMESGMKINSDKISLQRQYYHITVTDNGIGFDQQYSEKIFEVFQRLHHNDQYAGTGIGLAIVKRIVENHNGIITASGEVGKGATFNIYIPA